MSERMQRIVSGFVGAGIGLLVVFAWGFCHSESYCFFWPWIDTVTAAGYIDEDFQKITSGMSRAEVDALMCPPLATATNRDGSVTYGYTRDGKCKFGDFAWFDRAVDFRNDRVVSITSCTYYD